MQNTANNTQWILDTIVRAPLADINAECLDLLMQLSRESGPAVSDFIAQLRPALRRVKASPRQIAARARLLLVDLEFANADWWRAVAALPGHHRRAAPSWLTPLPKGRAIKLARATLMLAWHLCHADAIAAEILMGLSKPVIEVLSRLDLQHIDVIGERQFTHLRPRWEERPSIWLELLANDVSEAEATRAFTLRALQLGWAIHGAPRAARAAAFSR